MDKPCLLWRLSSLVLSDEAAAMNAQNNSNQAPEMKMFFFRYAYALILATIATFCWLRIFKI